MVNVLSRRAVVSGDAAPEPAEDGGRRVKDLKCRPLNIQTQMGFRGFVPVLGTLSVLLFYLHF